MEAITNFLAQNDMFTTVVGSLVALTVCIAVGYVGRKAGMLTDSINTGMSAILVTIAVPSTIFISMMRPFSRTLFLESLATLVLSAVVFLAGYVVGGLLARILGAPKDEQRVWQFSLIFANVGFMGFPVIQAIYGYEGMIYVSMANVTFNVLAFTLGIYLFKKESEKEKRVDILAGLKAIFLNPALVITFIGYAFFITGFRLPETVHNGVELVSGMTVPLSMMLVGSILAKSKPLTLINDPRVLPVIFMRLLGIPAASFFLIRPFIPNPMMLEIIVILAAMPVGALTVIFAEKYKGNTAVASKLIAISSFLSLLTIPLISLLMD